MKPLLKVIDGTPSFAGISLLYGVPVAQLEALPRPVTLPDEWARQGRRRAREAEAHTGSNDVVETLAYWASRDLNAAVTLEDGVAYLMTFAEFEKAMADDPQAMLEQTFIVDDNDQPILDWLRGAGQPSNRPDDNPWRKP